MICLNILFLKSKKKINKKKIKKINFFGITFKENCADYRNSLSLELYKLLKQNYKVDLHDPYYENKYLSDDIFIKKFSDIKKTELNIITVNHKFYVNKKNYFFKKIFKKNSILFDLKNIFSNKDFKNSKIDLWQL